jgi:hypothetical protein
VLGDGGRGRGVGLNLFGDARDRVGKLGRLGQALGLGGRRGGGGGLRRVGGGLLQGGGRGVGRGFVGQQGPAAGGGQVGLWKRREGREERG